MSQALCFGACETPADAIGGFAFCAGGQTTSAFLGRHRIRVEGLRVDLAWIDGVDDGVLAFAPAVEIDHLAAFGAEREMLGLGRRAGGEFFFADGAGLRADHYSKAEGGKRKAELGEPEGLVRGLAGIGTGTRFVRRG